MEEAIDIYNEDRTFTGKTIPRSQAHLAPGEYMLYVLAIIKDAQGRYLITQRSLDKHWAPGAWEVPGGGVHAGESSEDAVVREVREEVGLDASAHQLEPFYSYRNVDAGGDNYIVDMYLFERDVTQDDVVLQEEEAIACRFATWKDIEQLSDEGMFLHFERVRAALASLM